MANVKIPSGSDAATIEVDGRKLALTNLNKVFWPALGLTKRDLLQYYAEIAGALLPHVRGKAMVMKRYPNGIAGDFFFMKRAPSPRPEWIETCAIQHGTGLINFPMVQDVASLLWVINLGCIDLNPWYGRCETSDRPEYVHFDLDPFGGASFEAVREAALIVHDALRTLGMTVYPKTSGSKGMHLYVGIKTGPVQHDVWAFAKRVAVELAKGHSDLLTAEYKVAKRPKNRVFIDYGQNRLGATLASIYSVRPTPQASVSTPVTWDEVEDGIETADFTMKNVPKRVAKLGDLWKPLTQSRGRYDLAPLLGGVHA